MQKRIYIVNTAAGKVHFVRSSHPNRAIAHVVEKHLGVSAEVASPEQLVEHVSKGAKVEDTE